MTFATVQTLTTNVGGSLSWTVSGAAYAGFWPMLTASQDWAPIPSLWKQYRVESVRLRFVPRNRYSKATTNTGAFSLGIDMTSNVPAPSWADSVTYSTTRILTCDDPAEVVFVIPQDARAIWYDIGSTTPTGALFVANPTTSLSASTDMMDAIVETVVSLRGRA